MVEKIKEVLDFENSSVMNEVEVEVVEVEVEVVVTLYAEYWNLVK